MNIKSSYYESIYYKGMTTTVWPSQLRGEANLDWPFIFGFSPGEFPCRTCTLRDLAPRA